MPKFMNAYTWKQPPDDEFLALIPEQLEKVNELVAEGVLLHIFIAADNTGGWAVYSGSSSARVLEYIKQLPLYKFMNVNLIPLSADFSAPQ